MAKITCNYQMVENAAFPKLEYAISLLKRSYIDLSTTTIPREYSKRTELSNSIENIRKLTDGIKAIEDDIVNLYKKLEAAEDTNLSEIANINEMTIKERNKIIKNS